MQTLFNRFDLFIRFGLFDVSARAGQPDRFDRFDDGRDNWVGLTSAAGLCALLVSDLISLL